MIRFIESEDPDVVCLQEVWLNVYVRRFISALPEFTFQFSDTLLFNRSGLVLATKRPVKSVRSGVFPDSKEHNLEEKLAGKGWQLVIFENVSLLHTHLYYSKGSDFSMTQAQLQQLEALDLPDTTVLVGDCNLPRNQFCENTTRFVCPENTTHTHTSSNSYANARFNNPSDAKLSYITPSKEVNIRVKTNVCKQPIMSDHYALISYVEI